MGVKMFYDTEFQQEFSSQPISAAPSELQPLIARLCRIPVDELLGKGGDARVKFARQTAMYLMHVVCGVSLTDIAEAFGRTRPTASDACHRIEDLRDDSRFDQHLTRLEELLRNAIETGAVR
jgi:chromosomal replication initiation ATPase DnaA